VPLPCLSETDRQHLQRLDAPQRQKALVPFWLPPTVLIWRRQQPCSGVKNAASEIFGVAAKQNLTIFVHLCSIIGQDGDNPEVTQLRSLADLKTLAGFTGLVRVGE